ncbi:MAG: hypothetical protein QXX41_05385 [Nitrososphaerota archaeon]
MTKRLLLVIVFLLIFCLNSFFVATADENVWESYEVRRPWALGIVIPDGAPTSDGETVKWDSSSNLTVVLNIPRINMTDGTIYAIVSVMTESGVVLQAAAGIEKGDSCWRSYAMYVRGVYSGKKEYVPVLLGSPPTFLPGDSAIISIYSGFSDEEPAWFVRIINPSSREEVLVRFFSDGSSRFMRGDHEVVALESYTKNEEVFRNMGEMVLESVFINGKRILGGWYVSDGQVFMSNLLFEVGAGEPVPSFLYLVNSNMSSAVWGYSHGSWGQTENNSFLLLLGALLLSILVIIFVVVRIR